MTSTWQFWRVLIPGVAGDTLDKFVKFEFSGDELVVTAPGAVSIGDAELSAFGQIKTQTWVGATSKKTDLVCRKVVSLPSSIESFLATLCYTCGNNYVLIGVQLRQFTSSKSQAFQVAGTTSKFTLNTAAEEQKEVMSTKPGIKLMFASVLVSI